MTGRCSICANEQVTSIDADLAVGLSIRATARKWLASRSSLARHARHAIDRPAAGARRIGQRDHFDEAARQLGRARTERERLRALENVRAAVALELRDFARARVALKAPDEGQLRQLKAGVEAAWQAYQSVAGGSLDVALRGLAGVREALAQLRSATARAPAEDPVVVRIVTAEGDPVVAWQDSSEAVRSFYKVPKEFWTGRHKVRVSLNWLAPASVMVTDKETGKQVWQALGVDRFKPLLESAANGNHPKIA